MLLGLLLATATATGDDAIRAAVLKSVADDWARVVPFLCVQLVSPPPERGTKFWHIKLVGVDPPAATLGPVRATRPLVVPRSACSVGADYDGPIVLRKTSQSGGVAVSIGPVSFVGPEDARVVVLTWAGGLSHTFSEWKIRRKGGVWTAVGSTIILQE